MQSENNYLTSKQYSLFDLKR